MKYNRKVYPNGLRLITVPMKDTQTVTVMILVEAGSKYETKDINGISHFLEHMCFKGTVKRPTAYDIAHELDGLGAQSNAFTSQEYTGYYAKGDAKHMEKYFDIISDIYKNSTFPKEEIEKERGVIIEEINMYEDSPRRQVYDELLKLVYGDQPAGWSVLGPKENIRSITREDFIKYHKKHYSPSKTIVVVSGNIDTKKVDSLVKKEFLLQKKNKSKKIKTKDTQNKPLFYYKEKKQDQAHMVMAFRSLPYGDKQNLAVNILSGILAGGMSSRLFQKLREEMGVCYYVRSYNDTYTDHGLFTISAGVDTKRVSEVVKTTKDELKNLIERGLYKGELERVKEYLLGNLKIELETSESFAHFYADQEIMNKPINTISDIENKYRAVTEKDVISIAKKLFKKDNSSLAIIGPKTDKEKIKKAFVQ